MSHMISRHPLNSLLAQTLPVLKHLLHAHALTPAEITLEGAQSTDMRRLYTHTARHRQRHIQPRVRYAPTFSEQQSLFLHERRL
jgi:hypothetical protein